MKTRMNYKQNPSRKHNDLPPPAIRPRRRLLSRILPSSRKVGETATRRRSIRPRNFGISLVSGRKRTPT